LCTGIVGTNKKFWFDVPRSTKIIEELKSIENIERIKSLKNIYDFENNLEYKIPSALTRSQLEKMKIIFSKDDDIQYLFDKI
jgi:hypothetical protein